MNVLIQQVQSGNFLNQSLEWEEGIENAMDFESSVEAIEYVLINRLSGVQIVIRAELETLEKWLNQNRSEIGVTSRQDSSIS